LYIFFGSNLAVVLLDNVYVISVFTTVLFYKRLNFVEITNDLKKLIYLFVNFIYL